EAEIAGIKRLLTEGLGSAGYKRPDYSPLADSLSLLADAEFLHAVSRHLAEHFAAIRMKSWIRLMAAYPAYPFSGIFAAALESGRINEVRHLMALLDALKSSDKAYIGFIDEHLARLPDYLGQAKLTLKENRSTVL